MKSFFYAADELKDIRHQNLFDGAIAPVLFRLLYTCGLRSSEGRKLRRSHINFETGEIKIAHNKQRDAHMICVIQT